LGESTKHDDMTDHTPFTGRAAGARVSVRRAARLPGATRLPLGAALLVSAGVVLSSVTTTAWAQTTSADSATTTSTTSTTQTQQQDKTLPSVKVAAKRDLSTDNETISAGALGTRAQVDTPFSTNVKTSETRRT
jgi:iron complex outermembrane receptor protein